MATSISASPGSYSLGVQDLSGVDVKPSAIEIPQHLALGLLYTKKGPTSRQIVNGAKARRLYGDESFDKTGNYFNHQTLFAQTILPNANMVIQRIVPEDAGAPANFRLYIDLLTTTVDNYVRNSDGSIAKDVNGDPIVDEDTPLVDGYKVKFIKEYFPMGIERGKGTMELGTMVDSVTGDTSVMYPLFDFAGKERGEHYNNTGVVFETLLAKDISSKLIEEAKVLPYALRIVERKDRFSNTDTVKTLYGEPSLQISLKADVVNPITTNKFDIGNIFPFKWANETDAALPLRISDFDELHTYYDNIDTVLKKFVEAEAPYITATPTTRNDGEDSDTLSWFDFTTEANDVLVEQEAHLFNIFSLKSSQNIPYHTVTFDTTDVSGSLSATRKEIVISSNHPIFLEGGSDGTLSDDNFNNEVMREISGYNDPDNILIDKLLNPESIMYDSGFPLDVKKKLVDFISIRKDTMLVLTTHEAYLGKEELSTSDARAVAVALKTQLKMAPESDYFGTPVMRGMVVLGTGLLSDDSMGRVRIPVSLDLAHKASRYMGASNGKWKSTGNFDIYPGNTVELLKDLSPKWIPDTMKNALWSTGVVWVQPGDTKQTYFYPGIQTVYDDDTSVLNSMFTVMAAITLEKLAYVAWRNHTGTSKMSRGQLRDSIVSFMTNSTTGIFDDRVTVSFEVEFTEQDIAKGYSWNLINTIKAENMKTVQTVQTRAYRK